jgi:hypothetical protein
MRWSTGSRSRGGDRPPAPPPIGARQLSDERVGARRARRAGGTQAAGSIAREHSWRGRPRVRADRPQVDCALGSYAGWPATPRPRSRLDSALARQADHPGQGRAGALAPPRAGRRVPDHEAGPLAGGLTQLRATTPAISCARIAWRAKVQLATALLSPRIDRGSAPRLR